MGWRIFPGVVGQESYSDPLGCFYNPVRGHQESATARLFLQTLHLHEPTVQVGQKKWRWGLLSMWL